MREVRFAVDKRGRPVAFRYCRSGMRWFRCGYDEAKLLVATGQAHDGSLVGNATARLHAAVRSGSREEYEAAYAAWKAAIHAPENAR